MKSSRGKSTSSAYHYRTYIRNLHAMEQRFGPYEVGETIGRGTFAKVKVAVHEATKTKVALKVIPRKVMEEDPKSEIKIKREIKILQVLRHPHVMRQYDVVQTKHDIILVLEYVSGGELFDYISRRGRLHESLARLFFQQLIAAVGYCHVNNVAHRDLKPENILLEQNMKSIKVGDFGLSSIIRDGKLFETSCGTPNYAAPEVVSGKLYSGKEADVWSCGVVLFTMLAGGLPFDDPYVNILFKKIQSASYQMPSFVPKGAQDIIARMLVPDPLERATVEQIVQHPWVREQFPAYLVNIHTEALYQAGRFARDAKLSMASQLDSEVVAYVAARFRLPPQRVVAIVGASELGVDTDGNVVAKTSQSTPAAGSQAPCRITDAYLSVADEKVRPEPLIIPLAETKLRDEEHDVVISYNILLDRKWMRKAMTDASPQQQGSAQKHVDPTTGSGGNSGAGGGSGRHDGETASSFIALKYSGAAGRGAESAIPPPSSAIEYGSLRGYSLGPQSHRPAALAAKPTGQGNLQRAPDGTMHFSPMSLASPAPNATPFVDVFVSGYNQVAQPRVEVRGRGNASLVGSLLGVKEVWCGDVTPITYQRPKGTPSGSAASPGRLLKPLLNPPSDVTDQTSPQASSPTAPVGGASELLTGKFGADFMRNGVLFRRSDAQTAFSQLCAVLKAQGFLWKTLQPFAVVAVRHPSDKVMCKVFKVDQEDYLVDVRVSVLSGMSGMAAATDVLVGLMAKVPSR